MVDSSLMLNFKDKVTDLSPTEQLYTARGSQGMGMMDELETFGLNPEENYASVIMLVVPRPNITDTNYKMRPLFTMKAEPDVVLNSDAGYPSMINYPLWLTLADISMDEVILL